MFLPRLAASVCVCLFNSFFFVSYRDLHRTIIDPRLRMKSLNTCSKAQRTQVTDTGDFSCPSREKVDFFSYTSCWFFGFYVEDFRCLAFNSGTPVLISRTEVVLLAPVDRIVCFYSFIVVLESILLQLVHLKYFK